MTFVFDSTWPTASTVVYLDNWASVSVALRRFIDKFEVLRKRLSELLAHLEPNAPIGRFSGVLTFPPTELRLRADRDLKPANASVHGARAPAWARPPEPPRRSTRRRSGRLRRDRRAAISRGIV